MTTKKNYRHVYEGRKRGGLTAEGESAAERRSRARKDPNQPRETLRGYRRYIQVKKGPCKKAPRVAFWHARSYPNVAEGDSTARDAPLVGGNDVGGRQTSRPEGARDCECEKISKGAEEHRQNAGGKHKGHCAAHSCKKKTAYVRRQMEGESGPWTEATLTGTTHPSKIGTRGPQQGQLKFKRKRKGRSSARKQGQKLLAGVDRQDGNKGDHPRKQNKKL